MLKSIPAFSVQIKKSVKSIRFISFTNKASYYFCKFNGDLSRHLPDMNQQKFSAGPKILSRFKGQISQYFGYLLVWLIIVFIYFVIRFLGNSSGIFWANEFRDFLNVGIVSGIILGTVNWLSNLLVDFTGLKKRSYYVLILFNLFTILVAIAFILMYLDLFVINQGQLDLEDFWRYFATRFGNLGTISFLITLIIASIILSLIRQMRFMIGSRVLINILMGKYHFPQKENKIFMFLDMKSSTTIAEKIGHVKFSRLIQDCFYDMNEVVLRFNAEIYKYIGDEAILSWPMKKFNDPVYLDFFFHYDQKLQDRAAYYTENYGVVPEFKAGINAGEVTTLEVGVLKKEIAHLSDVLNTAARIQGMCNPMNAKILVSDEIKKLSVETSRFTFNFKEEMQLRGKEQKVEIYEVKQI